MRPTPSLRALAARLRTCTLELYAYVDRELELVDASEDQLQALIPEPGRRDRLHEEVRDLLKRFPEMHGRPPLFGVLVGVKDIYRVDGLPTRCGAELPAELFEGAEASLVTLLRDAGALILGKTVTTEFAYFEPGPTRNPRNPLHTPGGSSSGSAAAVAAGYCPLALGSQTIGSVVRPAAFCGVAGFKPTAGSLPMDGVVPYSRHLDHPGFFTPTAGDLDLVLDVWLPAGAATAPASRWATVEGDYLDQADPEAQAAYRDQVLRLEKSGLSTAPYRLPASNEEVAGIVQTLAASGMWETHERWYGEHRSRYRPRTQAQIEAGRLISHDEVEHALRRREILRAEAETWATENGIGGWLAPAAPGPAPAGLSSTGHPSMNAFWTLLGLPVAAIRTSHEVDGLPLGLQVIGLSKSDHSTAQAAGEIELKLRPQDSHAET